MNIGGVRLGRRLSTGQVERMLGEAREAAVTYDHVGSTLAPDRGSPARSPYVRRRELGAGDDVFATAVERLRTWAPQQAVGSMVHPFDATPEEGTTILVELRRGPAGVVVPNRVVAVVDEPGRFGFAYGTLPGHVETGEESFLVEQGDDGLVTATVTVDAGLGTIAAHLAAPMVLVIQRLAVDRYLDSLVVRSGG